jgi:hypothetical protein
MIVTVGGQRYRVGILGIAREGACSCSSYRACVDAAGCLLRQPFDRWERWGLIPLDD